MYGDHPVYYWLSALAALECPMSVEDKIRTLTDAIVADLSGSPYEFEPPEQTGLDPFDKAVKRTYHRLIVKLINEEELNETED